ncbi:MAG TPA: hypothetical protein VGA81_04740, partial [Methylomirabilota bacterium]
TWASPSRQGIPERRSSLRPPPLMEPPGRTRRARAVWWLPLLDLWPLRWPGGRPPVEWAR